MSERRSWLSVPRIALVVAAVLLFLVLGPILSAPEPEPIEPDPDLHAWDLIGCYRLRYEGWGDVDAPVTDRPLDPSGVPGGALSPPASVMLLPDSVDAWGRVLPSYRAVPVVGEGARGGRSIRWFVDADTLWVLWSEGRARAAVALRRTGGDSLVGSVRAVQRGTAGDSLDLNARAGAVPINCATGERLRETVRTPR